MNRLEIEKARRESNTTLKNWIWAAVDCNQPIPGNVSIEACRYVLLERGEDGKGYHNT